MEDKFVNLKELPQKLNLTDKKKSTKGEKTTLRNVRWIRVDKFGKTKYRYLLDEKEEWKEVDIIKHKTTRNNKHNETILINLTKSRPIAAKKFDNIQEQLPYIPENLRGFYTTLTRAEND
ncbi:hypothetical protein ILUMI_19806 [Ignelater luminosus]|uniref:Uncharacterized protein n=1 Tax=Ignelater luminosus TaxID=2038154 RepID=A0A8K0CJF6_IGNLU|nr:hypothetical protein ILUMI_19806 [Ignelater luminosus]